VKILAYILFGLGNCALSFIIGLNWKKLIHKYRFPIYPQFLYIIMFTFNLLYSPKMFDVGFAPQMILNILIASLGYLGIKLQMVGLTGGIACGKSTVSDLLREEKAHIIDADKVVHKIYESDPSFTAEIVKHFGERVIGSDGKVNRKILGQIVFEDAQKRRLLKRIIDPRIRKQLLKEWFHWKIIQKKKVVVFDAPLLFESKILQYICYPIIVVHIKDENTQIERLINRNQISREEAIQRLKSQMPLSLKCKMADILVDNSGTEEELESYIKNHVMAQIEEKVYF